jgi:small-conductance mechanosensitive channel
MKVLIESLIQEWHNLLRVVPRLFMAIVLLLVFIWIGRILGRALGRLLERGRFSGTHKKFFQSAGTWLFLLIGLILALNVIGMRGIAASLLAGGGVTAVILGFAFREIGENFLAGFVLAFSRPFEVGDLIQSEEMLGEVRGIELRHTHIRTADGRDIYIPSSQIINKPLTNFTKDGLRRPSFTVGIDYADDSEKARQLLLKEVQSVEGVLDHPSPGVLISALAPQYVELEAFFWVDTFRKDISLMQVRNNVMERCRRVLIQSGYTLSANVTTSVDIGGRHPVDLRLLDRKSD